VSKAGIEVGVEIAYPVAFTILNTPAAFTIPNVSVASSPSSPSFSR
jgi:hypothetical protein